MQNGESRFVFYKTGQRTSPGRGTGKKGQGNGQTAIALQVNPEFVLIAVPFKNSKLEPSNGAFFIA